ncbi:MAG: cation:proton antiporter [Candidatus Thiodiazotropha sp.]
MPLFLSDPIAVKDSILTFNRVIPHDLSPGTEGNYRPAQLPPTPGYLIVGNPVSPIGSGVIPSSGEIRTVAEFGVVILLFGNGLSLQIAICSGGMSSVLFSSIVLSNPLSSG